MAPTTRATPAATQVRIQGLHLAKEEEEALLPLLGQTLLPRLRLTKEEVRLRLTREDAHPTKQVLKEHLPLGPPPLEQYLIEG